ncbi:carboxylesterase [Lentithecium fluviatile CBS 122367]|uniref:Carboxylic ester hydrolase n=1 Tax=Lentithecium fluviatile CBS 122367 TaxID=1168545 RepID=A0A6G1IGU0_9PLEO|nr:carboxylesterase [Lentithecium fluviatile CBS 122367]
MKSTFALGTLAPAWLVSAALYNQTIHTEYGSVQGIAAFDSEPNITISNWRDITIWKGIPFAADTSGQNRWRPPQKRQAWNTTLVASEFGDTCPGQPSFGIPAKMKRQTDGSGNSTTSTSSSEDCLNLNIWTSANSTEEKHPVMIWSYPAGGSAAQPLFDGAGMAAKGIVYVNYNYRTAAFGWLAHPQLNAEMQKEVGYNVSGNWAMLDQFAVLKWAHENIAAFGGDPERITVAGQSAGSAATYHMLNSPLTKGLIKGAIIESGVRYPRDPFCSTLAENYRNMTTAFATGETLMEYYNATTIDELRELSAEDLSSYTSGNFGAVLDYWAIPDTYLNTLLNGPANDVPILTGNTKDESGAELPINITVSEYNSDLQSYYGDEFAARFLTLFPASNNTQAGMAHNAIYSATSRVGTWLFAKGWVESNTTSPIYTYFWDHAPPGQDRGAYHESEINYVLNNLYGTDSPWEGIDLLITQKMSGYWANFVKTQNPNNGGNYDGTGELVQWSASTPNKSVSMRVGDGWGDMDVATDAQVELFQDWFASNIAY